MKKQVIFISIFFLFSPFLKSQTLQNLWAFNLGSTGEENGRSVVTDNAGNIYVTGEFSGTVDFDPGSGTSNLTAAGNTDIYIAKYSSFGTYKWSFRIGSSTYDRGHCIELDGLGNIFVTGYFSGIADFDPGAGIANLTSLSNNTSVFLAKFDTSGAYQWAFDIGNSDINVGYSVDTDGSGNVYLAGVFSGITDFDPSSTSANLTSIGPQDNFVAKYNSAGNYQWAFNLGSVSFYDINLAVNNSGDVYVSGNFFGTADFDPGPETANLTETGGGQQGDIFVAKYNSAGNYQWAFNIGGTTWQTLCLAISLDNNDNVYITGNFRNSVDFDPGGNTNLLTSNSNAIYVAKYNSAGIYEWAFPISYISGSGSSSGSAISTDMYNNVFVTGSFNGNCDFDPGSGIQNVTTIGQGDIFLAKYSSQGEFQWVFGTGSTTGESGRSICADNEGNVFVSGSFSYTVDFAPDTFTNNLTVVGYTDAFIAKYKACSLEINVSSENVSCNSGDNGSATVIATGETGIYTYLWDTNPVQTTATASGLTDGTYNLLVTDINNCVATQNVIITVESGIASIPICLVTVDTLSTHNIIYWEKPITALIDSFLIYREINANVYQRTGAVAYEDLNEYHDFEANPNTTTYKYKISVLDTCGFESVKSGFHNTIHLQNNGNGNLAWTHYGVENSSNPVTYYRVYRDDLGTNNFQPINSNIPGGNSTYTDVNYAAYPNARYVVDVNWGISCTPFRSTVTTTRSNRWQHNIPVGLADELDDLIKVYPNPVDEIITIEFPEGLTITGLEITNVVGARVYADLEFHKGESKKQIDVSILSSGVYSICILSETTKLFKKIVIN